MCFRIRKRGRLWTLWHIHQEPGLNARYEHVAAESSHWASVMWVATGDRSYAWPGWTLVPSFCGSSGSTGHG